MARHVLSVALICVSFASFADTIPEDAVNTYFAPQTILDGYPGCDARGQIAFRTDFVADNVDFSVAGSSAYPRSRSQSNEEQCYRIERRGTESLRLEVSCGNDGAVPVAPFESIRGNQAEEKTQLSVRASVYSCMTPTSYRVLGGSWEATLNNGLATTVQDGVFQPWDDTAPCSQNAGPRQTSISLRYAVAGTWGNPVDYLHSHLFKLYDQPFAPAYFSLELRDLSLGATAADETALRAQARMTFFASSEEEMICPDGVCSLPQGREEMFLRYWSANPAVCR